MNAGFWAGVALVLIGAIFGGLVRTLVDLYLRFEEIKGIASALKAEIDSILTLVKERKFVGKADAIIGRLADPAHLLTLDDIFAIPVAQDYFSVFNSVSQKIGFIGDSSSRVVGFYAMVKSLIDEIQALAQFRENVLRGLIPFDQPTRQDMQLSILATTQKMKAFFSTTQAEGKKASQELGTHANMGFGEWIMSRFRRKTKARDLADRVD